MVKKEQHADDASPELSEGYVERLKGAYREKREKIGTRVQGIRSEISEKVKQRLTEINEQMTGVLEWFKRIRKERLTPEQRKNLQRVLDFQFGKIRKKLDSAFRLQKEGKEKAHETETETDGRKPD